MIKAVRESEDNYTREQEQAKARDEQLRSVRQTDRSGLNYFTPAKSTPIRNDNPRPDMQGVHFDTNPTRHVYSTTSDGNNHHEPPENDSIIQTVTPPQSNQPMTNTTRLDKSQHTVETNQQHGHNNKHYHTQINERTNES